MGGSMYQIRREVFYFVDWIAEDGEAWNETPCPYNSRADAERGKRKLQIKRMVSNAVWKDRRKREEVHHEDSHLAQDQADTRAGT